MVFLTVIEGMPNRIRMEKENYVRLKDIFSLPGQKIKDSIGTGVSVLSIEVDTSSLIILNQRNKLQKLSEMTITELGL